MDPDRDAYVNKAWLLQIALSFITSIACIVAMLYIKSIDKRFDDVEKINTLISSQLGKDINEIKVGLSDMRKIDIKTEVAITELTQRLVQIEKEREIRFRSGP